MIHSFAVVIDGVDLTSPVSPKADALFYEAGCADALLANSAGMQRAVSDRETPSFAAAVAGAIGDRVGHPRRWGGGSGKNQPKNQPGRTTSALRLTGVGQTESEHTPPDDFQPEGTVTYR